VWQQRQHDQSTLSTARDECRGSKILCHKALQKGKECDSYRQRKEVGMKKKATKKTAKKKAPAVVIPSAKTRGRPKKNQFEVLATTNLPTDDAPYHLDYGLSEKEAQRVIRNMIRADPHNNDPEMMRYSLCITGVAVEKTMSFVGREMVDALYEKNAAELQEFFDRIMKRKIEAERSYKEKPHRNFYGYKAYCDFKEENGFNPSKSRLKKFILGRLDGYLNMPDESDLKGWSDIWKDTGLFNLEKGQ
jgi:hypothetical protein